MIPSFSREEFKAANYLEEYLKIIKLKPYRSGNNIWLKSPEWDDSKETVLLNSHIDTVKPVTGWTRRPFSPKEIDGMLYGLGSNDAGASLVSLLFTFIRLTERNQPCNFIFLASAEEEVSGSNGIVSVLPLLGNINCAIVGEPTGMQPAVSEKGLIVIDAIVTGKSGHAALNEGENAIYNALNHIEWFRTKHFKKIGHMSGEVKMNVTMINAGSQHNVIPDECGFTVDVRTNECYSNKEIFDEIAAECGCDVYARSFKLNSSSISMEHPLVKRAVSLGITPFASQTLSDMALMPFPAIKIGPGYSARSHTANEFVYLQEIKEAIDIYFNLLNNIYCYNFVPLN
jgi:acetylornithine deacetylase